MISVEKLKLIKKIINRYLTQLGPLNNSVYHQIISLYVLKKQLVLLLSKEV